MVECPSCLAQLMRAVAATHLSSTAARRSIHSTTAIRAATSAAAAAAVPARRVSPQGRHRERDYNHVAHRRLSPKSSTPSDASLKTELKYLRDPIKLAEHVKRQLQHLPNEDKALALCRISSRATANIVSWNHVIDYQMQKGKMNAAFSTYNELKKRGLKPDSHTYMMLLRGLAQNSHYPTALGNALSLYHSMTAPGTAVAPTIMHVNAVLKVCARVKDFDSMWDIVARLPEKGPHAADNTTFTTLLNGFRSKAISVDSNAPEMAAVREDMVVEGRKLWLIVVKRWRAGDLMVDEAVICAMGRLLLAGSRPRDWDDVLSLVQQTMDIPRMIPRLGTLQRSESSPRIRAPGTPESLKNDASAIKDPHGDFQAGNEFEPLERSLTVGRPKKHGIYAKPGNNTLSLLIEACLKMVAKAPAKMYWDMLAFSGPHDIFADADNLHMYMRVLRQARSSSECLEFVNQEFPRFNVKPSEKTYRIAMSCATRDVKNPNVMETASQLLDSMQNNLRNVDPKTMTAYLELAIDHARDLEKSGKLADAVRVLCRSLERLEPNVINLRQLLSFGAVPVDIDAQRGIGAAALDADTKEAGTQMLRRLIACYSKALSLAEGNDGLMPPAQREVLLQRKAKLDSYAARLGKHSSSNRS